jgi:plastocyanin
MSVIRLPKTARALLAATFAVVVGAGLAGVPAASAATRTTSVAHHWKVRVGAETDNRAIQTMGFYPRNIWVNQGDTVTWVARSAEIHTVTFLSNADPCPPSALCAPPRGFDPAQSLQSTPQGRASFDGSSYYNSGVLTSVSAGPPLPPFVGLHKRYSLTFPDTLPPGTYTYFCLVHGQAMQGRIIVQKAGTPYPFTQRQYTRRAHRQAARDVADGIALWAKARRQASRLSTRHHPTVLIGAMDGRAMVMRFIHGTTKIRVGDRVTFRATSMGAPHTVTFGNPATGCGTQPCLPQMPWNVTMRSDGNESATYPGHNGGYSGDRHNLNSGFMFGLPPSVSHLPSTLTVAFHRAGRYDYVCALHAYMGMVGEVVVRRRAS